MYLPRECKDQLREQWAAEVRVTGAFRGWSTLDLLEYPAADSRTRAIIRAIIDSRRPPSIKKQAA